MTAWQSIDTLEDLKRKFHTESSCVSFVFHMKWPHGFVCPRCQHTNAYVIQTRRLPLYECRACRHQTSLTAGTVMEGSRTALWKWLTAFWLVSRSDRGINAVYLSSIIGVTYKTAWLMLHKIRAAISMSDVDRPLAGKVQGIVAFHGTSYHSMLELHPRESPLVIATSVTPDDQLDELKMKLVKKAHLSDKYLLRSGCDRFVALHVTATAFEPSIIQQPYRARRDSRLYRTFKRARRWMNDTFHGIGATYLQRYLDEFCFRYNATAQRASAWERLVCICMSFCPASSSPSYALYNSIHCAASPTAA
ncbi:transposase [Paenibacillus profundus]|uniref:Transposase n=1 Tax=Paenibacillus profundus TaxID=1173085 RepID=A0ABS8Y9P8_9BACL|nr:transposase [Paenibacillus profundus]MCE5168032.1 transposase [Paenibacillus profundus]